MIKQLKFELPGNTDLDFNENQKFGARQNRYGIYGDNGYSELIEIKRRKMEDQPPKSKNSSLERKQEIKLSKDGLVTVIQKMTDYHKL